MHNNQPVSYCSLSDGRQLAYSEYGAPGGKPALYFHGTTSSRLEGALYHHAASEQGIRLITMDRPGAGQSDPLGGRRLLDWPNDIVELAQHLGLSRYAVAGGSGGGAHALACASRIPEQLTGVVLVNTAVPPHPRYWKNMPAPMRLMLWLYLHTPRLAVFLAEKMAANRNPNALRDEKQYAKMRRFLNTTDRNVMDDTERRLLFADAVEEGLCQDPLMFATEARIFLGHGLDSWGFNPIPAKVPIVALCGRQDGSIAFAEELVQSAPGNSRLEFFAGGHIAALGEQAAQMSMQALVSLFPE